MHTARTITSLSLLAGLAILGGCGLNGPAHQEPLPDAAAVIDMGFSSFEPATVHIHAAQTVEWRNTSFITHNVSDDKSRARKPGDASVPEGAAPFNSGDLAAGQIFIQTFTVPGTYKYFCSHHEDDGMVGTVIVDPAP